MRGIVSPFCHRKLKESKVELQFALEDALHDNLGGGTVVAVVVAAVKYSREKTDACHSY